MALTAITGWRDSAGTVHENKRAAEKAEARWQIETILHSVVDFRNEEIDFNQFIAQRDELIEALQLLKD